MLAVMLFATLLAAEDGTPTCFISGEVYSTRDEIKAALAPTNCPIDIKQDGKVITMTSPKWVVQVQVPDDIGKQEFLYLWGQSEARIGDQTVLVSYKPADGA
jgi:hypothetical protein